MSVTSWQKVDFHLSDAEVDEVQHSAEEEAPAPFQVDEKLNNIVKIVKGPHKVYADLRVGALVNRTNGRLNDWTGLSKVLLDKAGPTLAEECGFVPSRCQVGECKVTRGCGLSAQFLIHTVGPKFTEQYRTASETALHSCYKNAITVAMEQGVRSVALPCIYSEKKEYPREEGAHVAVRTIRRFLEHFPEKFDHVVFYLENDSDLAIYRRVLMLYFPRDKMEEAWSQKRLPPDVGNEWGDKVIPDRQIRINANFGKPAKPASAKGTSSSASASSGGEGDTTSLAAKAAAALAFDPSKPLYEEVVYGTDAMVDNANYKSYLERAKFDDLKDILALNIVYQSGTDELGRPIVVWVVANMNVPRLDLERLFLYTIFLCDKLVTDSRGYILVICDDSVSADALPNITWVKNLYEDVIGRKYKKNIKAMYVLHPTLATKMLFWAAMPFVSSKFWDKHYYFESLEELYRYIPAERLILPKKVYQHDAHEAAARNASWFDF